MKTKTRNTLKNVVLLFLIISIVLSFIINTIYADISNNEQKKEEVVIIDHHGHWAEKSINCLLKNNIVHGYPDVTFKPERNITRAEFIKAINNIKKYKYIEDYENIFNDVKKNDWFYEHALIAANNKYIEGYSDKTFRGNEFISREEVASIIIRAIEIEELNSKLDFKDVEEISDWAKGYIETAVKAKLIEGYPDNTLRPQNYITRAEVCFILAKLVCYKEEQSEYVKKALGIIEEVEEVEEEEEIEEIEEVERPKKSNKSEKQEKPEEPKEPEEPEAPEEQPEAPEEPKEPEEQPKEPEEPETPEQPEAPEEPKETEEPKEPEEPETPEQPEVPILKFNQKTGENYHLLYRYEIKNDNKISILGLTDFGYDYFNKDIIIPDKINDKIVNEISHNAFDFNITGQKLNSVILSDNIQYIRDFAFKDNNLISINLPEKLLIMQKGVFNNNKFTDNSFFYEVYNNEYMNSYYTNNCDDFTNNETVTLISYAGENRENIYINENVKHIKNGAFSYMTLNSVNINKNIKTISYYAFENSKINEINIELNNYIQFYTASFLNSNINKLTLTKEDNEYSVINIKNNVFVDSTLNEIEISSDINIIIEDDYDKNNDILAKFADYYNEKGKIGGKYIFNNNNWEFVQLGLDDIFIYEYDENNMTATIKNLKDGVLLTDIEFTSETVYEENTYIVDAVIIDCNNNNFENREIESVIVSDSIKILDLSIFENNLINEVSICENVNLINIYNAYDFYKAYYEDYNSEAGIYRKINNDEWVNENSDINAIYYDFYITEDSKVVINGLKNKGDEYFDKYLIIPEKINGMLVIKLNHAAFYSKEIDIIQLYNNIEIGQQIINASDSFKEAYEQNNSEKGIYTFQEGWIYVGEKDISSFISISNRVKKLDKEDYTIETYNNLELKIDIALSIIRDENSTQEDIEDAVDEIDNAIDLLEEKTAELTIEDLFEYEINNENEITLKSLTQEGRDYFNKELVIPDLIEEKIVTIIDTYAFSNENLLSVTMQDNIKIIHAGAFENNNLTSINIPDSIILIDEYAFRNNKIEEVSLINNNNITEIKDWVFNNNKIERILLNNSIEKIGNGAFSNNNITEVILPDSIKEVGNGAFTENNINILNLNQVEIIDSNAFCINNLSTLILNKNLIYIGDNAFASNSLENVTFGENIEIIGNEAFKNNNLTEVDILNTSITDIRDKAFLHNNITKVIIREGIELGEMTFTNSLENDLLQVYENNNRESGTYLLIEEYPYWIKQ